MTNTTITLICAACAGGGYFVTRYGLIGLEYLGFLTP